MAEEKKKGRHTLNMEERERVRIGGVMEVLSFDEDGIMMETTCGLLLLKGAGCTSASWIWRQGTLL